MVAHWCQGKHLLYSENLEMFVKKFYFNIKSKIFQKSKTFWFWKKYFKRQILRKWKSIFCQKNIKKNLRQFFFDTEPNSVNKMFLNEKLFKLVFFLEKVLSQNVFMKNCAVIFQISQNFYMAQQDHHTCLQSTCIFTKRKRVAWVSKGWR